LKIKIIIVIFQVILVISLIACSSIPRFAAKGNREKPETIEEINVERNYPFKELSVQEGVASFYADKFHGRRTASGEIFDKNKLTAAHRTLPLNSIAMVTNLKNNKKVRVKINDRGPFVSGRIIDLSKRAAEELDFISEGTAKVRIEIIKLGDNKFTK
jgi:rare lipoprotein A